MQISLFAMKAHAQHHNQPPRWNGNEKKLQHFFLKKVPNASPAMNTRLLFKELASYNTALPVEYGSSCFCRVINSRLDLLRVMITGPDDTPYANGCFLFDINLPTNYPKGEQTWVQPVVQTARVTISLHELIDIILHSESSRSVPHNGWRQN